VPGWTGQLCDVNADECLSQPCQNGANCTDLLNGFRCKYGSCFYITLHAPHFFRKVFV